MFWVFASLGLVLALVVVALGVGAVLPRDHVGIVRVRLAASPAKVWSVIGDPLAAKSWRQDVKRVERLPDVGGKLSWREESGFGLVTYVLEESTAGKSFVTRIADDSLPYGGAWEHVLKPDGSGTELTITERGFVKPSFFRFMARFVFGYTGTIQKYLIALGTTLGERVSPEVVDPGH